MTKAEASVRPTHQITQMKTVAKFCVGDCGPKRPMITTKANSARPRARTAASALTARPRGIGMSSIGREMRPSRINRKEPKNDMATAAPAPAR